ncbi:MAG: hypothetical protein ACFB5Z_16175 [Elainellaceae cyanobacterium]
MMNWYSQLTRLIFDFYREEPAELRQLQVLQSCRLSRWWGTLRISCPSRDVANAVAELSPLLCEPISQLRLAQEIKLIVNGSVVTALAVQRPSRKPSRRSSDRLL